MSSVYTLIIIGMWICLHVTFTKDDLHWFGQVGSIRLGLSYLDVQITSVRLDHLVWVTHIWFSWLSLSDWISRVVLGQSCLLVESFRLGKSCCIGSVMFVG